MHYSRHIILRKQGSHNLRLQNSSFFGKSLTSKMKCVTESVFAASQLQQTRYKRIYLKHHLIGLCNNSCVAETFQKNLCID